MSDLPGTTMHVHISVRGVLAWDRRQLRRALRWITKDDGTRFHDAEELREAFMDELAQGHEVLPYGKPCEGFDYKTGCPGHAPVRPSSGDADKGEG